MGEYISRSAFFSIDQFFANGRLQGKMTFFVEPASLLAAVDRVCGEQVRRLNILHTAR